MNVEQRTKEILDKALSDVIQELMIIDNSGNSHIAYIHRVFWDNGLQVEFSTPDGDKEALIPYVHAAMNEQIQQYARENPQEIPKDKATMWSRIKSRVAKVFGIFANYV